MAEVPAHQQDALEKVIAAAPGVGGPAPANGERLQGGAGPLPEGSLKLSAPNFLSKEARGHLYLALLVLGGLSVAAGVALVWNIHADEADNWVTPTMVLMGVGLACFIMAYLTVGGFGNVSITVGSESEEEEEAKPLSVTDVTPKDQATGVDASTEVKATFSAAVAKKTVTSANFTVKPDGGAAVVSNVAYDEDTKIATLKPTSALAANKKHIAMIGVGVTDVAGKALTEAKEWSFTTKP